MKKIKLTRKCTLEKNQNINKNYIFFAFVNYSGYFNTLLDNDIQQNKHQSVEKTVYVAMVYSESLKRNVMLVQVT